MSFPCDLPLLIRKVKTTSEAPPRPKLLKDTGKEAKAAAAEAKAAAEEKAMELIKEKEKEMLGISGGMGNFMGD